MFFGSGPPSDIAPYAYVLAVIVTLVAATTDWRTGHIPNWLTLPLVAAGPILYGMVGGLDGLLGSLLAIAVCSMVPVLLFWRGGMHGGDVKLFAAIAALVGLEIGIEAQFLTFVVATIYALGRLAWDGRMLRTMSNVAFLAANPVLPQRLRKPISPELLEKLRLGGAIFAGTLIAVFSRFQVLNGWIM